MRGGRQVQIQIHTNKNTNIYKYKQCGVRQTICNLNICGTSSNQRHLVPKAVHGQHFEKYF